MWFGKNIMTKLGLVLAMAVPALAADTYPLYYTGKTTAQNNDYWDSLMIFKAWGTTGVDIGGRSALPGRFSLRPGPGLHQGCFRWRTAPLHLR